MIIIQNDGNDFVGKKLLMKPSIGELRSEYFMDLEGIIFKTVEWNQRLFPMKLIKNKSSIN